MSHPLDSFDNSKFRCKQCGEYAQKAVSILAKMEKSDVCVKCLMKLYRKSDRIYNKVYNKNKQFNTMYSIVNSWLKNNEKE